MQNKLLLMKLSHDEDVFLRHWIYDETHYQTERGPAKKLQIEHRAIPADLAVIVAASIPDPEMQEGIGNGPPPEEMPKWPWTHDTYEARIAEARATIAKRRVASLAENKMQSR